MEYRWERSMSDSGTVKSGPVKNSVVDNQEKAAKEKPTVLIIDDEQIIIDVIGDALSDYGCATIAFRSAAAATEYYVQNWRRVDLVIMDVVMPGMTGPQCFDVMKKVNPEVKVILTSGYAKDGTVQRALDNGVKDFISKPYRLGHLISTIEKVFNSQD